MDTDTDPADTDHTDHSDCTDAPPLGERTTSGQVRSWLGDLPATYRRPQGLVGDGVCGRALGVHAVLCQLAIPVIAAVGLLMPLVGPMPVLVGLAGWFVLAIGGLVLLAPLVWLDPRARTARRRAQGRESDPRDELGAKLVGSGMYGVLASLGAGLAGLYAPAAWAAVGISAAVWWSGARLRRG